MLQDLAQSMTESLKSSLRDRLTEGHGAAIPRQNGA